MINSYFKRYKNSVYISLMFVASTGIFGTNFLPILLSGGIIMGVGRQLLIIKKRLNVLLFFMLLMLLSFFLVEKLKVLDLSIDIFILTASIITSQIFYNSKDRSKYKLAIWVNLFFICYLLITKFLGLNTLVAIKLIFIKSSYHMAFWLSFIINAISIIELSHKTQIEENKNKILLLSFLFFISSILLTGRSGIIIGTAVFLYALFLYNKRVGSIFLFLVSALYFRFGTVFFESLIQLVSKDLFERGIQISVREFIWNCYFENLTLNDILFGFDKIQVAGDCLYFIDRYDGRSGHLMTESSWLSLVSSTGVIGLFFIIYLIIKSLILSKDYFMHFIFVLGLVFRVSTADFLFFSIYDFFFFILIFNYRDSRTTDNSLSRKTS